MPREALNRTIYAEGGEIQDHIKLLRTRKAAVDSLTSPPMNDETCRGIIIRSIPPTQNWLPVIPSLYGLTSSTDIVSTLLAHGMIIGKGVTNSTRSSTTALAARTTEACANPNCKAKKRSTHTTANCYWPGGGKEGQFPPGFGQRNRANIAAATTTTTTTPTTTTIPAPATQQPEHFVLSARIPNTPGESGVLINDERSAALISKGFQQFQKGKIPTFMDSGASDTMFVSRESFSEYKSITPRAGDSAKAVDGSFEIIGEGTVVQRYLVDGQERNITYTRALHTPTLNANLISISAFDRAGLTTTFGNGKGTIQKPDGTTVLTGQNVGGMYLLEAVDNAPNISFAMTSLSQPTSLEQWHRRFTHCSPMTIQGMVKNNLVDGLKISDETLKGKCEDCILGRQTRRPFDGETEKNLAPLDLVAFDLWGPSRVQSVGGKLYLMIIIDGGTSYKYGTYTSDKSDPTTLEAFEIFRVKAETVTGKKVRRLRTDRAFESTGWREYCQTHGITHEFTAPYSSAQNGIAERAIRTTIDDVRTLLRNSGLGHSYWAEAAAYSIDTRNLIPSRRHPDQIPSESFSGRRQSISHLRVFGAKCWAKIPNAYGGSKLDPRSSECRLLGYASGGGNYKVQDVASRLVFVSRDVVFEEGEPSRTSASVGEQIPLFDVHPLTDKSTTPICDQQDLDQINDQQDLDQPNPDQPILDQINHDQPVIPG